MYSGASTKFYYDSIEASRLQKIQKYVLYIHLCSSSTVFFVLLKYFLKTESVHSFLSWDWILFLFFNIGLFGIYKNGYHVTDKYFKDLY